MLKIEELLSEIMDEINRVQNKYSVKTKFSEYLYEFSRKNDEKHNNFKTELFVRKYNDEYYVLKNNILGELYFTVDENEESINFKEWISLKKNSITEEQAVMLCEKVEDMTTLKIK